MKYILPIILSVIIIPLIFAQIQPPVISRYLRKYNEIKLRPGDIYPDLQKIDIHNVDYHARIARAFLKYIVPEYYHYDVQFFSFIGIDQADRLNRLRSLNFWLNNLHFQTDVELLKEVPGSDGQLYWFFLEQDFGWSRSAFLSAMSREPYFVEPYIYADVAQELRKLTGIENLNYAKFHVGCIVRADFFFRETVETDRSQAYYDILYSKQRFPLVSKSVYYNGTDNRKRLYYPHGKYVVNKSKGNYLLIYPSRVRQNNFPANEADFENVFGVDSTNKFLKHTQIFARFGSVVDEGQSVVANQVRLVDAVRSPFGRHYKTFDTFESVGKKDFAEQLFFDIEFDAGEIISNLPAGGQAYLLINNLKKRVETADPKAAKDQDTRDPRVRTPGSCVICHEKGIIEPPNLIPEMLKKGMLIKFKKKEKARQVKGFFLDWDEELRSDQARYERLIAKTSGFKPAENAVQFRNFRTSYDRAITIEQASVEAGVPVGVFKLIAFKSPSSRLNMLSQGLTIPRQTWERQRYREFMDLLTARRTKVP